VIIGIASADYLRKDRSHTGTDEWGGSGWARVGQYIPHLRSQGHEVVCGTLWKKGSYLTVEDGDGYEAAPDLIILQRLMHGPVIEAIQTGKAAGQVIVNDVDDWYWGLDTRNEAFLASHPKYSDENTNNYKRNIAHSDFVTVSTPYLADRLRQFVKCPIFVHPNYIDVGSFTKVEQVSDECPLFGWAGSTSHRSGDLELMSGILAPLVRNGTIRMHHSGNLLSSPTFASKVGLEEDEVTTSPRVMARDYPSLLTFEAGIVPLRNTPFNWAKSDIKGLEYAAAGIPFIASSSPAYLKLKEDFGGAMFTAAAPKDWIKYIKKLTDKQLRIDMALQMEEAVSLRDISVGGPLHAALLESLV
jgi:glycosyltransferase involved in cell wall biosynthesis